MYKKRDPEKSGRTYERDHGQKNEHSYIVPQMKRY